MTGPADTWGAEISAEMDKAEADMRGELDLASGKSRATLYCSFCGKSQHEVAALIAGPVVFICDGCVELCNEIVREKCGHESPEGSPIPQTMSDTGA